MIPQSMSQKRVSQPTILAKIILFDSSEKALRKTIIIDHRAIHVPNISISRNKGRTEITMNKIEKLAHMLLSNKTRDKGRQKIAYIHPITNHGLRAMRRNTNILIISRYDIKNSLLLRRIKLV